MVPSSVELVVSVVAVSEVVSVMVVVEEVSVVNVTEGSVSFQVSF